MSLVLAGVLFFLFVSLLFYVLFGGADFGAGILEMFIGKHPRRNDQIALMGRAIAPVWEANHVWVIIAVVILFMGFPPVYESLSIYLHIPMILALMGIVARGTAFTFRHYDPYSPTAFKAYTFAFRLGSFFTPFLFGTIIGSLTLGQIDPQAQSFQELYVYHWLNPFSLFTGLFTCALCAFLAAVYLHGEAKADKELKEAFGKKARISALVMVALGGCVFLTGLVSDSPVFGNFFNNALSLGCFGIATLLLWPALKSLGRNNKGYPPRILAALLTTLVFLGWWASQGPDLVKLKTGGISYVEAAAPEATLRVLLGALLFGSLFIFPALGWLFKIFKWPVETSPQQKGK